MRVLRYSGLLTIGITVCLLLLMFALNTNKLWLILIVLAGATAGFFVVRALVLKVLQKNQHFSLMVVTVSAATVLLAGLVFGALVILIEIF